jgi:hypothetical protein
MMIIYLFINIIISWKYSEKINISGEWGVTAYLVFFVLIATVIMSNPIGRFIEKQPRFFYHLLVACLAIILLILMKMFDPAAIDIGRYPALYDWLERLFDGQFPYLSKTKPSGLPFLFILAIPSYLLGDLGLLQIFSFITFALILDTRFNSIVSKTRIILFLIASPIFHLEIVTRSELFSNMVFVLLLLAIFEKKGREFSFKTILITGLIAGLLLSTRVVVLYIYIIFFGHYFFKKPLKLAQLSLVTAFSFMATLVPFLIWDFAYFVHHGPLAVQSIYAPLWFIITTVILAIILGFKVREHNQIYPAIAFMLFGIVLIPFFIAISEFGIVRAVFYHQFDISYFCFCLPFVLISLRLEANSKLRAP